MKVVLLAPTPPPTGGIAMWTVRMMNATLKNDWKVEVVDEKIIGKREFFGDKVKHNIKDEIVRCFTIWKNLIKALADKDTKVVHACIPANTMPVLRECVSAIITKVRKRKFITHFRCTVPNMVQGRANRMAVTWLCKLSDCVMLLNQDSVDFVQDLCSTPTELIPNFVDEKEIEKEHVIRDEIQKVVYVGGVIETKGCLDLIEVAKAYPQIEFRLIGNPDSICSEAASRVSNVLLLGTKSHDEAHAELNDADVFTFLTYFPGEGFSNALAEAMATGLPCIVTDWAANKDMIGNDGGVVVGVKDIDAAIQALDQIKPVHVRQAQSKANIAKVKNEYIDRVVIDKYVDCYEKTLRG